MRGSGRATLLAALAAAGAACARGPRFTPYPEAEVAGVRDPHAFRGQPLCQRCHVPGAGLAADPVSLCLGCHRLPHGNHPVNVAQRSPVADLPLLEGNRVACHSCHDPHDLTRRRAGLRLPVNELCRRCHPGH